MVILRVWRGVRWSGRLWVGPLGKMVYRPSMRSCATSIRMFSVMNQACLHVDNWTMQLIWLTSQCRHLNTGSIDSARWSKLRSSSRLSSCLTALGYIPVYHHMTHRSCLYEKMGDLCICINYHSLNHQTRLDVFPIPCVANLFNQLCKAIVFSSINLSHAYH